jgi:hypothetical protein
MIRQGSIVKCTYNFDREREVYGYKYPHTDDLLTVTKLQKDSEGEVVLWFDELKIPVPLYENCFVEVQDEAEGDEILNEAFKIANNL